MSIKEIGCKIAITVATAATMIGMTVVAKVGYDFFTIKVLPTAAQFGAKCGSAMLQNGLVFGASAGIALAIDLISDIVINKVLAKKGLSEDKTAQMKAYFIKRAITVIAVVGFALIAGASPLVPIVTLVVLLAKDILEKAIGSCKTKTEETTTELPEIDRPTKIQQKFNEIEALLPTRLTTKQRKNLNYCIVYLKKAIEKNKETQPNTLVSKVLENKYYEQTVKKLEKPKKDDNDYSDKLKEYNRINSILSVQKSKQAITVIENNTDFDNMEELLFENKVNEILKCDLNFCHNLEF